MSISEEQIRVVDNDMLPNYGDGAIPVASERAAVGQSSCGLGWNLRLPHSKREAANPPLLSRTWLAILVILHSMLSTLT
jgi:hypothetical protein